MIGRTQPAGWRALRATGFTLVELMVTLAISIVLMSLAVPAMQDFIARKRVASIATELASDLRYLPSMGQQRQWPSQIDIATTCYVLSMDRSGDGPCDCGADPPCGQGTRHVVLKQITVPSNSGVTFTASRPNTLYTTQGQPLNNDTLSVTITATHGGSARVSTNGMGMPSVCSVTGQESNFSPC